ncbi:MAG: LLM class F420-dependent oxidoreductase [Candidatus Binatia bacterium]
MKFGVFLPISGRAAGPETLVQAARQAEALGYEAVWAADRIIIPWEIKTTYPYSEEQKFIVPPDRPFLEPLTCLAFLAGCTEKIKLGMSVLVLPYRHPLYSAKVATTIDHLSNGRFILGVGVGWMREEFEALGLSFEERGKLGDEQIEIIKGLWKEDRPSFEGHYYRFDNVAFYPKGLQKPSIPIWVGGEGLHAQRRAGRCGDAWFPYFVKITPQELAQGFDNVRRFATEAGRIPEEIALNCCLPIEITSRAERQEEGALRGTPEQIVEALQPYAAVGVSHLALQFMVPRWPERMEQIERFATEAMPALQNKR